MQINKKSLYLKIAGIVAIIAVMAIMLILHNDSKTKPTTKQNNPQISESTNSEANTPQGNENTNYEANTPQGSENTNYETKIPQSECITITVTYGDGTSDSYSVVAEGQYLEGVMNMAEGLTYTTDNGMVMTINGVRADYYLDGAYWYIYVNGNPANYGIKDLPANIGDVFELRYTKA